MDTRTPDFQTPTVDGNTLTMKWAVTYEDIAAGGETVEHSASIRFRQSGSRVIGEGETDSGVAWSV